MNRSPENTNYQSLLKDAFLELRKLRSELEVSEQRKTEPIAIIGMSCRFPGGANDSEAYWQLLSNGVDAITEIPSQRWDVEAYYDPNPDTPGKMYTRHGGFLDEVDKFDPQFFGISPREAASMDPQQRLLLEVSYTALENAAQAPEQLHGSRTGVFIGISFDDYSRLSVNSGDPTCIDAYSSLGNARSIAVGRLSYMLGLQGPTMQLDTTCSSSLLAVHLACQSLRNRESNLALAGGVNLMLSPEVTIGFCKLKALAADGCCKTFDANADGYVRGEGCGIVVLKRLSDAVANKDNILALIRGSAVNHDGLSNGLTAPNGSAQEELIRQALCNAKVEPAQIQYVEAHGTGTSLGDPIEVLALGKVLSEGRKDAPLAIGSVKTNFGHLESAAGIASLMKVVLSLQHKQIPPHLHFQDPNPYIPWEKLSVVVPKQLTPWPEKDGSLAGVSSFGMSGTNVHVVLEDAPVGSRGAGGESSEAKLSRSLHLLTLSAKNEQALQELARLYADFLKLHPETSLADVCFTAATGRSHYDYRLAVVAGTTSQLCQQLDTFAVGNETFGPVSGKIHRERPKIAFLFTGQGSQYVGMGRQLYETQPTFRIWVERGADILHSYLEKPLLEVLYADAESHLINETVYTQPALFVVEYALYQLWKSWGIAPDVVIGHSLGEYVAACAAGIFSFEDGLKLIAERARLMQALPQNGTMVAVFAEEAQVAAMIASYADTVAIAAVNGPQQIIISGEQQSIDQVVIALEAVNINTKRLQVSHAFHSPLMAPMLEAFEQVAQLVSYSAPQLEIVANISGRLAQEMATPRYWCQQVLKPVQFAASMTTLQQLGCGVCVEIGPQPTLLGIGRCLSEQAILWLASLRPGQSDWQSMLSSLAELYLRGVAVDWSGVQDENRQRLALPTYPFQRQRYWLDARQQSSIAKTASNSNHHPLLGQRLKIAKSEAIHFESHLTAEAPFLKHHRVFGQVVVPAAAYLEIALAAGAAVLQTDSVVVEQVAIPQALVLPVEQQTVQVILQPQAAGYSWEILSLKTAPADTETDWQLHAAGKVRSLDTHQTPECDLEAKQSELKQIAVASYYQQCRQQGIDYGPSFQAITQLWQQPGEALGEIRLPEEVGATEHYQIHPVLLDACLQVVGAALPEQDQQDTYLPVSLERLSVYGRLSCRVWSQATLRSTKDTNQQLTADVQIIAPEGQVLATLEGLHLSKTSPQVILGSQSESLDNWLYKVEWRSQRHHAQPSPTDFLPNPEAISVHLSPDLRYLVAQPEIQAYQELLPKLEAVSLSFVVQALAELGWQLQPQQCFTTALLAQQLGVIDQYQQLLQRLLAMLQEAGILQQFGQWQVMQSLPKAEPQTQVQQLLRQYPAATAELTLLERCGSQLAAVLRGECEALDLLFPQGDLTTASQLYQDSPAAKVINTLVQKAVVAALEHLPVDRTVRILEIGAGTGGTTAYLLPHLSSKNTEYVFTDVSALFTTKAQEKFQGYDFVSYQLLDIEQAPEESGQKYDMIVAANVLHATRELQPALQHVQQLLAPGGMLVLLEVTQPLYWLDLIFGLTTGWWKFTDRDLRSDHPLLSAEQWQQLLLKTGFQQAVPIAPQQNQEGFFSQQSVILAQTSAKAAIAQQRQWLILADRQGIGQQLAAQMRDKGQECTLVFCGQEYQQLGAQFQLDPANPADFQQLLEVLKTQPPLSGVVHLWSLDAPAIAMNTVDLEAVIKTECASTLYLVQSLVQAKLTLPSGLWLVTRGAVATGDNDISGVAQSPLWGLGRAIALEHPELRCRRVDLDPQVRVDEVQVLWAEMCFQTNEDQIALRDKVRLGARLVRHLQTSDSAISQQLNALGNQPFQLGMSRRGSLDNLQLQPMTRRQPSAGEVEIKVQATGLNFLDVLDALGLLPFERDWFGVECAGVVVALGEGVEFDLGQAVVALAPGSFSQYVTVNTAMVTAKPDTLSFEEAATIPANFLTAYYALHHVAKISQGDRVLIHAAAGGTGMAAVQLALASGAEVFATASPGKWQALSSLGVKHIMNSRTLDFATEVMAITQGEGVDIVLNSLSGEFISESLSVLKPQGRFLEIGKRGVWQPQQVEQFKPNVSYFLIDLMTVCQQQPNLVQSMLRTLMQQFASGTLQSPPQTIFPLPKVVEAFRYMQQAQHTGKIVLTFEQEERRKKKEGKKKKDGTYLITGGLGGLGLLFAEWLVQQGVRHLVLVGRSSATDAAQHQIQQLQHTGAQIVVAQADVSQTAQLTQLLSEIESSLPPLRGVLHAAGVLDDGVLMQLSWSRFAQVLAAKVAGAWNLHTLTQDKPIDLFVLFSSAAALLGSPGQANHMAANAFLDALAHYRQRQGLSGLSINWGAWSAVGAAAQRQVSTRMRGKGVGTIAPEQGLQLWEQLISQPTAQVGVVPLNWSQFLTQEVASPFFADFTHSGQQSSKSKEFLQQLQATPIDERHAFLVAHLQSEVGKVLGLKPFQLPALQQGFFDIGMDSLMAVELKNRLEVSLGVSFPSTVIFEYPTIKDLAQYIAEDVLKLESLPVTNEQSIIPLEETFSEAEAETLTAAEFAELDNLIAAELAELEKLLRN